jgi:hypothetical protein
MDRVGYDPYLFPSGYWTCRPLTRLKTGHTVVVLKAGHDFGDYHTDDDNDKS